jgi:transposase-like protein
VTSFRLIKSVPQRVLFDYPRPVRAMTVPQPQGSLDRLATLIADSRSTERCCPHCACRQLNRHGQANNRQRFRCRQCLRTFNDLTGTPLARLRLREKWLDYIVMLREARSVRAAAAQVGVHSNTALRWRHRFLDETDKERLWPADKARRRIKKSDMKQRSSS